ncbi:hypothetical protein [Streptomyces microflavus]|uniref:hypothetical protein n=1 Tax=Streptomyces microflavus TaxID=1919 RepID=UPI0036790144
MKEPKKHIPDDEYDVCTGCGGQWPCPKWQKWTASKDYRLRELERLHNEEVKRVSELSTSLHSLRQTVRENDMILRGGMIPMLMDFANKGKVGTLTVSKTHDFDDITTFDDRGRVRTVQNREMHVTYDGVDTLWEDGRVTERWTHP